MDVSRGPARWAQPLLFVVPALWSSNYLIARLSASVIAPHALALGRWALAMLLLLPFVWPELRRQRQALRREAWQLLVLGATGMWICGAFVYQAGHSTSATNIALIYTTTPILVTALGSWWLREPFGRAQAAALVMALLGVLVVISRGDLSRLLSVRFAAGDGWIAIAAVSWAVYSLLLKRWPSQLSPLARLTAIIAASMVVLVPGTLIEAAWFGPPTPSAGAIALVVFAALVPGLLSYAAYSLLQRELGASRTALMLYLIPVYSAFGAWGVLGEVPGWHHAAGAALILPGVWLATRASTR